MQSFIRHFNQYILVDPCRGNATFPAGFDRGLAIDLESYDTEFDTTGILEFDTNGILETRFHENYNIFISHPDKHKCNWKIVSTINVTYAPIQINWARNIASNYLYPRPTKLEGGYTGFTLSVCLSVRLSVCL